MSRRLKENREFLQFLGKASPKQRRLLLQSATADQIKVLTECSLNICAGNVLLTPAQFSKLKKSKNSLHAFIREPKISRKRLIIQKGGFLPVLLSAIVPILSTLITGIIKRQL